MGHNYEYNTGEVEFDYFYDAGSDLGEIDIGIANTSMYDPLITGFAFNSPEEVTSLESFVGPDGWTGEFDRDSIRTPEQYGLFDVAGLTGNNIGGGDPQDGIPVGETFDFRFNVAGYDLDTLTAASFLEELSYITVQGNAEAVSFLARAQQVGSDGELSDVMIPQEGSPNPIPEPTTMLLFGTGLIGLAGLVRRRKKT
ncbi:MAG: PEP-CTERM sorting domain-containing protein [Candidatus Moraniibacteriota bacterium]